MGTAADVDRGPRASAWLDDEAVVYEAEFED